jgi:hypothetical protein
VLVRDAAPALRAGLYVHYKGGLYLVLGAASHSESLADRYAIYFSLAYWALRIRPLAMFVEPVNEHGAAPRAGESAFPRFIRLGLSRASRAFWPEVRARLTR